MSVIDTNIIIVEGKEVVLGRLGLKGVEEEMVVTALLDHLDVMEEMVKGDVQDQQDQQALKDAEAEMVVME